MLLTDNYLSVEDIKRLEVEMCVAYSWNLSFLTFYDFLEHFLCLGILFSDDQIMVANSTNNEIITLNDLLPQSRESIIKDTEALCLHFASLLLYNFETNPNYEREIAYLIVASARKEIGIINFDHDLLR